MDSRKLNDWLQVVGLFGVIAGLIFVGLQLRQDRQIATIDGLQEEMSLRMTWAELVNMNPEVWVNGLAGELTSEPELARFAALASAYEFSAITRWRRANSDFSTANLSERFVNEFARDICRWPGLREWWENDVDEDRQAGAPISPEDSLSGSVELLLKQQGCSGLATP